MTFTDDDDPGEITWTICHGCAKKLRREISDLKKPALEPVDTLELIS